MDRDSQERQMFKAVCSECGKDCEVPFQPTEGKTVKCLDCFRKDRPRRSNFRRDNDFRRPRMMHKAICAKCKQECEVPFKPRDDREVFCLDCFKKKNNDSEN